MYALIGLSLVLLGIAGLQFTYLFYVDGLYRDRKHYIQTLEHKCRDLADKLSEAERLIAEQRELLSENADQGREDEAWADVIDA
jgi:hypothetical protein